MKTVSIIGSCVCRDLFEEDNEHNYTFCTDIRFSSPISMISKPVDFIRAGFDNFKHKVDVVGTNWYKKNLINDINKTAFSALYEKHGEYLVLDLAESRLPLAKINWKNHSENLIVTNSVSFRMHYKKNLIKNIFNKTFFNVINPLDYSDDFWKDTIKEFVKEIKNLFAENKIILIKTKPAKHFIDSNGFLHPYNTANHFNEISRCDLILEKLYSYFLEFCPQCMVIDFPKNAIGSQTHKWGNHPFHYTKIYYNYLFRCVNEIIHTNSDKNVQAILEEYKNLFSAEYKNALEKNATSNDISYNINYCELFKRYEEFDALGRKKKMLLYFIFDRRHFLKHLRDLFRNKK